MSMAYAEYPELVFVSKKGELSDIDGEIIGRMYGEHSRVNTLCKFTAWHLNNWCILGTSNYSLFLEWITVSQ